MTILASCPRFHPLARLLCLALAWPVLSGQAAPPAPERIVFPYENVSDLRGLVNAMAAFRTACLDQPVTRGLPEKIVPDGYRVVTRDFHYWGKEEGAFAGAFILSKTGREDDDFAGGHPIIDLFQQREGTPDGKCRIFWKRAWDYPDPVTDIMFDMAATFDAWVSYGLKAIRTSRPDNGFAKAERYSIHSEWATPCWNGKLCRFVTSGSLDPERGIDLMIVRDAAAGEIFDDEE